MMNHIEICIYFIIAILGLGYPILIQVFSGIDSKYNSTKILELFRKELIFKTFRRILYYTLIVVLLHVIQNVWINTNDNTEINVIHFSLVVMTLVLIVSFFLFIGKILVYFNRLKFIEYLKLNIKKGKDVDLYYKALVDILEGSQKRGEELEVINIIQYFIERDKVSVAKAEADFSHFGEISKTLYWAIDSQKDNIAQIISRYVYSRFQEYREGSENEEFLEYPSEFYDLIYNSSKKILSLPSNSDMRYLENRAIGGVWLLGEFFYTKISEETYKCMWYSLLLAIQNQRDDIVLAFWGNSCQYFKYSMRTIDPIYSEVLEIMNKTEIENRSEERMRFLEFHYALGGLLIYQKRYDCIRRMFRFTQTEPPSYVLLPTTMTEVFRQFFKFSDSYDDAMMRITLRYPFPDMEGMNADGIICNWICKYITVLFLRQYTLISYTLNDFVFMPLLPEDRGDKVFWKEHITSFNPFIDSILTNDELMTEIGFGTYHDFAKYWSVENRKMKPCEIIEDTQAKLDEEIKDADVNQELDVNQVEKFNNSTKRIMSDGIKLVGPLLNKDEINNDYKSWSLAQNLSLAFDKTVFLPNSNHINFDTILATESVQSFMSAISNQFYLQSTESYLLGIDDFFKGIDKLDLDKNRHVILAFSLNLSYFLEINNAITKENEEYFYKDIPIKSFQFSNRFVSQTLFVLDKSDMPCLCHYELAGKQIENYKLKLIDEEIYLYTSVIDLNNDEDVRNQYKEQNNVENDADLKKKALAVIEINVESRWKNSVEIIRLKLYSQYQDKGLPNSLDDIKPLN